MGSASSDTDLNANEKTMDTKDSVNISTLGYTPSNAKALAETQPNATFQIFSGFTTSLKVGCGFQDSSRVIEAELRRRGVRFLPQQVIRRLQEK